MPTDRTLGTLLVACGVALGLPTADAYQYQRPPVTAGSLLEAATAVHYTGADGYVWTVEISAVTGMGPNTPAEQIYGWLRRCRVPNGQCAQPVYFTRHLVAGELFVASGLTWATLDTTLFGVPLSVTWESPPVGYAPSVVARVDQATLASRHGVAVTNRLARTTFTLDGVECDVPGGLRHLVGVISDGFPLAEPTKPPQGLYGKDRKPECREHAGPSPSPSATVQPSPSATVQPSPSATVQPSPSATVQPSPSGTVQPSPSGTVQPSPSPTSTGPLPTLTSTASPSTNPSPRPSGTITASGSPKPSPSPTTGP